LGSVGVGSFDDSSKRTHLAVWIRAQIRVSTLAWPLARDTGRAMSQENVDTVARLYNECWAPGKLELVPEILHPDIVWTAIESAPDSGTRRGHVGCRGHINDWLEGFELKLMPIQEARSAPDGRLVCDLHVIGTERRTGLTTDIQFSAAFRFAPDGRLIEIHEYATRREALEAVGLRE
jgi:ketosteroid isomerase-like protein